MTLTLKTARTAIMGLVDTIWSASGTTSPVTLVWENTPQDKTASGLMARASMRTVQAGQTTQGTRRFVTEGIVTVQVFTPTGDGHSLATDLAQVVLDGFRAHTGGADGFWLTDIQALEVGVSGGLAQTNVEATYRYLEVV